MKRYYINNTRGFANAYNLVWAETPEQIAAAEENGYERITRREAEKLCAMENDRRKYDPAFSGYASNLIYPIDWDAYTFGAWENDRRLTKDGCTIIYKH